MSIIVEFPLSVGLIRQPKWGHLKDMHQALKLCEPAMAKGDTTMHMWLGSNVEVCLFSIQHFTSPRIKVFNLVQRRLKESLIDMF